MTHLHLGPLWPDLDHPFLTLKMPFWKRGGVFALPPNWNPEAGGGLNLARLLSNSFGKSHVINPGFSRRGLNLARFAVYVNTNSVQPAAVSAVDVTRRLRHLPYLRSRLSPAPGIARPRSLYRRRRHTRNHSAARLPHARPRPRRTRRPRLLDPAPHAFVLPRCRPRSSSRARLRHTV